MQPVWEVFNSACSKQCVLWGNIAFEYISLILVYVQNVDKYISSNGFVYVEVIYFKMCYIVYVGFPRLLSQGLSYMNDNV